MDVLESIRKRRFHRSFTGEPVDERPDARQWGVPSSSAESW